jgi:hypothetical protein
VSMIGGGDFGGGRNVAVLWINVPNGVAVSAYIVSDDSNTRYVGQFAIP